MTDEEKRGFVFHTPDGEQELSIDEVKALADNGDVDGLYAYGMALLFGWDIKYEPSIIHLEEPPYYSMPSSMSNEW